MCAPCQTEAIVSLIYYILMMRMKVIRLQREDMLDNEQFHFSHVYYENSHIESNVVAFLESIYKVTALTYKRIIYS